ncbi:MAG: IS3 family transposase, partial [Candidatus Scalindua sp.]|nr:IS3 family transposase [Candidatus Scalindua sp.]
TLTEAELSQYCREKGLYVEQVKRWKQEFLAGFLGDKQHQKDLLKQAKGNTSITRGEIKTS